MNSVCFELTDYQTWYPDGAFDDAISRLLCPQDDYLLLTRHVQHRLYERWLGFAPPGSATVISLPTSIVDSQAGQTGCRHIIMCPTMHSPGVVRWHHDIVYNLVWSLLAEVHRHNKNDASELALSDDQRGIINPLLPIRRILMPALGTGVGRIPPARFAKQFALAVKNFDEALRMPEKWSSLEWKDVLPIYDELQETLDSEGPSMDY